MGRLHSNLIYTDSLGPFNDMYHPLLTEILTSVGVLYLISSSLTDNSLPVSFTFLPIAQHTLSWGEVVVIYFLPAFTPQGISSNLSSKRASQPSLHIWVLIFTSNFSSESLCLSEWQRHSFCSGWIIDTHPWFFSSAPYPIHWHFVISFFRIFQKSSHS